jgi:hypothetical protein
MTGPLEGVEHKVAPLAGFPGIARAKTRDHEEPVEHCGLCGKDGLRYDFEIENVPTGKTLWVGSHCILEFDVSVFEEGQKLTSAEAKKKLERLTEKMRLDSCIAALEKLAKKMAASYSSTLLNTIRNTRCLPLAMPPLSSGG